jgi:adenylate kinase family enzyme
MQRVLIVGICGAGKSTLARELAARLNLPLVHLDREFWQPGWILPEPAWWQTHVRELAAGDRWIMDGSYASTLHHRLPRADTIVHLDFPRSIAMYRILKRIMFTYGKTRPDLADRCPEQFDWEFLQYAWAFPKNERPKLESSLASLDRDQTLIRLTRPREVRRFLHGLSA